MKVFLVKEKLILNVILFNFFCLMVWIIVRERVLLGFLIVNNLIGLFKSLILNLKRVIFFLVLSVNFFNIYFFLK